MSRESVARRPLTEQRLRVMEEQGMTDSMIARRLGISRQAVSAARKRWNLPKGVSKKDVPPELRRSAEDADI
jgi:transcriptional regulator